MDVCGAGACPSDFPDKYEAYAQEVCKALKKSGVDATPLTAVRENRL